MITRVCVMQEVAFQLKMPGMMTQTMMTTAQCAAEWMALPA